jgi:hypothetical protein
VKAHARRLISLVLVVGVFAFVLPRVADDGDVWEAVSGLGVVELGLTGALVSFGGHRAPVVAAVLLYRVPTTPIAIGGVCLLV